MNTFPAPKPTSTKRPAARQSQWDGWQGSEAALNLLLSLHPDRAGEAAKWLLGACRQGEGAQAITKHLRGMAQVPDDTGA